MKIILRTIILILILIVNLKAQQVEGPIERRLGFGAEFGVVAAIGGPYFGMAFSADYILAKNFSLGQVLSFIPSGDLTQVNANTVARFNIPTSTITFIPYMGVGFSYGSYETDLANENAFSFAFPIGLSVSYPVAAQIEAVARAQFALISLDYGVLGKDDNYFELMAGFRFSP